MPTSDDSVREIQLNGKQLVFLFMAVTVVSVVIFLCGVLVGRGVQARSEITAEAAATAIEEPADPTAPGAIASDAAPTGPTEAPGLGYQDRLEANTPPPEKLVKPTEPPPPAAARTSPEVAPPAPASAGNPAGRAEAAPVPATVKPVPANPAFSEPRGDGFAIQVAALSGRAEAEAVAGRLKAKGYAAFVLASSSGQPSSFRVRVGKFKTRAEAEQVAAKLEREEQFKPWITR